MLMEALKASASQTLNREVIHEYLNKNGYLIEDDFEQEQGREIRNEFIKEADITLENDTLRDACYMVVTNKNVSDTRIYFDVDEREFIHAVYQTLQEEVQSDNERELLSYFESNRNTVEQDVLVDFYYRKQIWYDIEFFQTIHEFINDVYETIAGNIFNEARIKIIKMLDKRLGSPELKQQIAYELDGWNVRNLILEDDTIQGQLMELESYQKFTKQGNRGIEKLPTDIKYQIADKAKLKIDWIDSNVIATDIYQHLEDTTNMTAYRIVEENIAEKLIDDNFLVEIIIRKFNRLLPHGIGVSASLDQSGLHAVDGSLTEWIEER